MTFCMKEGVSIYILPSPVLGFLKRPWA